MNLDSQPTNLDVPRENPNKPDILAPFSAKARSDLKRWGKFQFATLAIVALLAVLLFHLLGNETAKALLQRDPFRFAFAHIRLDYDTFAASTNPDAAARIWMTEFIVLLTFALEQIWSFFLLLRIHLRKECDRNLARKIEIIPYVWFMQFFAISIIIFIYWVNFVWLAVNGHQHVRFGPTDLVVFWQAINMGLVSVGSLVILIEIYLKLISIGGSTNA